MAMSPAIRRELRKLREIVHETMEGRVCMFCREPLLRRENKHGHGDGSASPIDIDLTLHHVNGDHDDNAPTNRAWVHRRCHKQHHIGEILHGKPRKAAA